MFPEFPLLCLKEMVDFSGQKVTVKTISSEDKANFVSSTILDNALKQAKGDCRLICLVELSGKVWTSAS